MYRNPPLEISKEGQNGVDQYGNPSIHRTFNRPLANEEFSAAVEAMGGEYCSCVGHFPDASIFNGYTYLVVHGLDSYFLCEQMADRFVNTVNQMAGGQNG